MVLVLNKLFKVVLPLATATTAGVLTASLISFKKENLKENKDSSIKLLKSIDLEIEKFEEEKITYEQENEEDKKEQESDKELEKENKERPKKDKEEKEISIENLNERVQRIGEEFVEAIRRQADPKIVDEIHLQMPEKIESQAPSRETDSDGITSLNVTEDSSQVPEQSNLASEIGNLQRDEQEASKIQATNNEIVQPHTETSEQIERVATEGNNLESRTSERESGKNQPTIENREGATKITSNNDQKELNQEEIGDAHVSSDSLRKNNEEESNQGVEKITEEALQKFKELGETVEDQLQRLELLIG